VDHYVGGILLESEGVYPVMSAVLKVGPER
jgi:hypothetical protein